MSLILERDYEAVSVGEICRRADVARSTFYAHFGGKDDLKRAGLDHLRTELLAAQAVGEPFAFVRQLFEHGDAHRAHYRALALGRGAEISLRRIREILAEVIRAEFARPGRDDATPGLALAGKVQYAVGALMGLLVWWLESDAETSATEMDVAFRRLLTPGLFGQVVDGEASEMSGLP